MRKEQRDIEKINEDTNDNDTDKIVKFNKDKATTVYRKNRNEQRDTKKTDEDINDDTSETVIFNKGRATKVCEMEVYGEKENIEERREKVLQNAKDRNAEKVNA